MISIPPTVDMDAWIKAYPEYYGPNAQDPDGGEGGKEVTDVLSTFSSKFTGYGGTFSTWSERHAFIVGNEIGMTLEKIEAVPTPEFWKSDAHYFKAGIASGYATKCALEASKKIDWTKIGITAASFTAIGTALGPKVLALIGLS